MIFITVLYSFSSSVLLSSLSSIHSGTERIGKQRLGLLFNWDAIFDLSILLKHSVANFFEYLKGLSVS